uniref:CMP-N-acetylneuraminate-beta-galactosamide-alpha-2,3-sialyltransferase 1 n=1 Tax=Taeniopygia guttata TaxID=59729 RepID=H0ZQT1_TAEGU
RSQPVQPGVVTGRHLLQPFPVALRWTLRCSRPVVGQNPRGKDGCEEEERENGHLRLPAHHGHVVPAELHTPGEHGHLGPPTSRGAVFRASTKTLQAPQETLQLPHVHFRAGTFPLVRSEVQLNYATFPDLTKCLDPRRQLQVKLQGEKAPRSLNATLAELFGVIPGDGDPLQERGSDSCRRCAVVGNSGNLRQSQYGPDIDSHDFVLRMNRAPTAGYESDVGGKTTHHFVYPESYRELAANVSMILIPFKTLDLRWVVTALTTGTINFTYVPVPRKIKVKKEKILVYNPTFMKYIYENWLEHHGRYPSTGLLSLMFALHVCDEVNVYGFGADSKGHWHHYWENNTSGGAFRKTGVHDGDFEFNITLTLASIEKIKFFKGR